MSPQFPIPHEKIQPGRRLRSFIALAACIGSIAGVTWLVTQDLPLIRSFIRENGLLGLLISIPVYASLGATAIPSEPLTLLVAGLYGPLIAALTASVGNLAAALVDYLIGSRIGAAANFQSLKERLPFRLNRFPINSPVFLVFARMIPGYGAKMVSLLSGAARVPLGLFLWTSAVQATLGAFSFAFGGWGILNLLQA